MSQEFDSNAKAYVTRDAQGTARDVLHVEEPFRSTARTALLAAREYLDKHGAVLGIAPSELANFSTAAATVPQAAGVEYRFSQEKPQFDMTTVVFEQTYLGLPVWQAGIAVHMQGKPFVVMSAQSTRHVHIDAKMPGEEALKRVKLNTTMLARSLDVERNKQCDASTMKILRERWVIYRYDSTSRVAREEPHAEPTGPVKGERPPGTLHPRLELPSVPDQIANGRHYVAIEVTFQMAWYGIKDLVWVAIIDIEISGRFFICVR